MSEKRDMRCLFMRLYFMMESDTSKFLCVTESLERKCVSALYIYTDIFERSQLLSGYVLLIFRLIIIDCLLVAGGGGREEQKEDVEEVEAK